MASTSSPDISKEYKEVHDHKETPDNTCRKCRRSRRRMNVKKFCKRDYVVVVHVLSRESDTDNWVKFTVNVMSIYKRKQMHIRRGASYLWVSRNDLSCKCPKIRVGRRYLVVGKTARHPNQSGYMINRRSIVLRWNDEWQQRIRKYIKYEKRGKC